MTGCQSYLKYKHLWDVYYSEVRGTDREKEFHTEMQLVLDNVKVFRIDDENLKKMLILTKVPKENSELSYPYPFIFLDVTFEKKELKPLGINIEFDRITGIIIREGEIIQGDTVVGKDLRMSVCTENNIDLKNYDANAAARFHTLFDHFDILNKTTKIQHSSDLDKNTRKLIYGFTLAFLNFVNNPEIEFIKNKSDSIQQRKREKRGKVPIPDNVVVRVTGSLKKYMNYVSKNKLFQQHSYRYWVKGHFRVLKSDKYGKNKGKRMWIMPYIKGHGVLMSNPVYSCKKRSGK